MPSSDPKPRRWPSQALGWFTGQRGRPIWILALCELALFAAQRAVLLLTSRQQLASAGAADILYSFLVGVRYDGVVIGYSMIPFVLLLALAPNAAFARRWFRRVVVGWAAVMLTFILLVSIIGVPFFRQFGSRLNWIALSYWEHPEVAEYIRQAYNVWVLPVGLVGGLVGSWLLLGRLFWRGARPTGPIWPRPIVATLLVGCCVLAARGSLGHHRLRFGPAYFSDNRTVCQVALNDLFTFAEACRGYLSDRQSLQRDYPFPPPEEAWATARAMLAQPADTFTGRPDNPLWRRTDTGRPRRDYNVVVIVMEGMAGRPVGALGHRPTHTPRFDKLCREGLYFERMYGVGERTCRGLVGVLCGHPDLDGRPVMKRSRAQGNFLTLPHLFARRGYRTLFLFGGNGDFDNMVGFFRAAGVQRFVDRRKIARDGPAGVWGLHDEVLFDKADEVFRGLGEERFFAVLLTLSNHEPFDIPPGRVETLPDTTIENKRLNAYRYGDWALGRFFDRAADSPYFRRTIFVLVPDHERAVDRGQIFDFQGYHLPCVIYAPGIVPPRRVATVASQTDLPPTLLGLLGGAYEHGFLGRDLLAARAEEGFAMLLDGDRLACVWPGRAMVLPPGGQPALYRADGQQVERIPPEQADGDEIRKGRHRMLSYFFVARQLYLAGAHNYPKP